MPSDFDPWSADYFNFKAPSIKAPEPKARVPKPVPDAERLFTLQRHSLDMLHLLRELEGRLDQHEDKHVAALLRQIETKAENQYKVINSYLKNNVAPSQGQMMQ